MKSEPYFYEILNKRVDKGAGVKKLAEYLDIEKQNIMLLGDQRNDYALIDYAGIGVLMGNAIPDLKEIAQYDTRSHVEDGVALAIEKFVLN